MKETPRHIKAFELYYAMGENRSLENLHQKYPNDTPKIDALKKWSKAFNWQQRVEQRDIENSKALEDKLKPQTNKTIVNTKADYRAEIKTQLGILKAILNQAINDIKEKRIIKVANTNELKDVVNSYEKLSKLDLLMMGEATERSEDISINFKDE
jgi:nitrate reductase NapAB chaperone NapD